MAAALASSIVPSLLVKLGGSICEEFVQSGCFDFRAGVKDMRSKLTTIQAVLVDAEERSTRDKALCDWLKKLKDAAYDIDDLLDEIHGEAAIRANAVRRFFSSSNPVLNRIAVSWKIKMLKKRLDEIATERIQFNLSPKSGPATQLVVRSRETISKVDESKIVGRGNDKEVILNMVLDTTCEEDISVIPIVGIGGLGKTTLAQLVFHDKRANDEIFDPRIWVSVSQNFNLQTIVAPILAATKEQCDLNNLEAIAYFLSRTFTGKKYLLVLDDVWSENQEEWERLKLLLKDGKRGSKIIVTTRYKRIAMMMRTVPPFSLRGLSEDNCWELFKLKAFEKGEEELYPNLVEIGREIVKKCGGVPLAANALGSMMRFKREPVSWKAVRDCEIWQLENDDIILPSLMLSYDQMPADLKQCFAYCSIFPKNYEIEKEKLIQQWIALGFIDSGKQTSWPKEDKGNEYFHHLLWMSFIQDLEDNESAKFGAKYAIHHLVYELAQSISREEVQYISRDEQTNSALDLCRYVSVRNGINQVPRSLLEKVRALHFRDGPLYSKVLCHSNCLRVLDLHGSQMKELPDFIQRLKHLRYLDLSSSCVESLPKSIHMMPNLETIHLSNCSSLKKLPSSICRLKNLQNLNLAACNLVSLPDSLGSLQNLKSLNLSSCSYLKELPESIHGLTKLQSLTLEACTNLSILPPSIGNLQHLQSLNLSQCGLLSSLPESLGNLLNLLTLNLSLCNDLKGLPESIGRLKKLQTFDLSQCSGLLNLPKSIGNLKGLQILNVSHNSSPEILPMSIGYLENLQILNLSMNLELKELPDSIGCLSNLRTLILFHCWNLKMLPNSIACLTKLETLNLVGCEELKELPNDIASMANLRYLINNQCQSLQGLPLGMRDLNKLEILPLFIVGLQEVDKYSSISELEHLNLLSGDLQIKFHGHGKSLINDVARARINNKKKLQSLELTWPRANTEIDEIEALLEALVPPPSLEVLHIDGYTGRAFSGWMSNNSLTKLVNLQLSNISNCSSIPPLGRLQFLQSIELRHLMGLRTACLDYFNNRELRVALYPSLKQLHFENLPNLEKWPTVVTADDGEERSTKVFMFPKLLKVTAIECPKVMPAPCLPPSVSDLIVTESSEMLSSRGPAGLYSLYSPSLLRRLWIKNCAVSPNGWCTLEYLSKLENLTIENCDEMRHFPASMRFLVVLKRLKVVECNNFEGLPEWIGDLATLESLELICCPKLIHLSQGLQSLSALDEIIISNCSAILKERCQKNTGKDWFKIQHIQNISIS
ncbi:putative disease resistance protein RGA1 [Carex littledalei]|uniref:Putative disease resistance protein RGA1 n=1 Tax=Carex littledalei TaxID=544730 RepID=A0A833VKM5_9POAL|nr:putative disease resistance protein RGA1 [Carex littledalei]